MTLSTVDLIATLEDHHVVLTPNVPAHTIHVEAPAGVLTAALRQQLKDRKDAILDVLWRLDGMRRNGVDLTGRGSKPPTPVARLGIYGGPNRCLSCAESLGHPDAYGRCTGCSLAAELYWRARPSAVDESDLL
jgi:hypothetical protein